MVINYRRCYEPHGRSKIARDNDTFPTPPWGQLRTRIRDASNPSTMPSSPSSLEAQICALGNVIVTIDTHRVKSTHIHPSWLRGSLVRWFDMTRGVFRFWPPSPPVATSISFLFRFRIAFPFPLPSLHGGVDNSNAIIATENRTTLGGFRSSDGDLSWDCRKVWRARYAVFDTMSTSVISLCP